MQWSFFNLGGEAWSSSGPPLLSRNAGERRVQNHLSAHARAKPIVVHTTSTCLFHYEIQKTGAKIIPARFREKCRRTKLDAEKTCQTERREL